MVGIFLDINRHLCRLFSEIGILYLRDPIGYAYLHYACWCVTYAFTALTMEFISSEVIVQFFLLQQVKLM